MSMPEAIIPATATLKYAVKQQAWSGVSKLTNYKTYELQNSPFSMESWELKSISLEFAKFWTPVS